MDELVTLSNFEEFEKITGQELSLIAFGSPWSSPCQNQYKIFLNFIRKYGDIVTIARVDAEKHPRIAQKCNIQSVPTLIFFREKREIKRAVGLQSHENIKSLIQTMRRSAANRSAAIKTKTGLPFLPIN